MSRTIAAGDTRRYIRKLRRLVEDRGYSIREIARRTNGLKRPERIHHSNLSMILSGRGARNLYLEQLLALLKILGVPPSDFFRD